MSTLTISELMRLAEYGCKSLRDQRREGITPPGMTWNGNVPTQDELNKIHVGLSQLLDPTETHLDPFVFPIAGDST